jgi:hypothetical protein
MKDKYRYNDMASMDFDFYPSGFGRVSGTRRVYHSTYKNHIKIISLMSKAQYTHAQN